MPTLFMTDARHIIGEHVQHNFAGNLRHRLHQ
jgi:hypothetical protein